MKLTDLHKPGLSANQHDWKVMERIRKIQLEDRLMSSIWTPGETSNQVTVLLLPCMQQVGK
jgi:hypothetical protein